MTLIIDKRFLPKNKTSGSRQKFIDRYKGVIKNRIREIVDGNSIKNFSKGNKQVKINSDDLDIPEFEFEPGTGNRNRIYIGNKNFKRGDKVARPSGGQGQKRQGSREGGGEDEFEFVLSEKEYLDLFFEDLALPDLIKKSLLSNSFEIQHAGYSSYGGPTSLNIKKTMLNALGRRRALKDRIIQDPPVEGSLTKEEARKVVKIVMEQNKKKKVPLIEDIDLKYNFKDKVEVPVTKAVMVCLMDVSGSMGEKEKDLAKRFFILLNLFLKRNYDQVDVVFVRHAETASEVNEEEFFHARITGGTIISSGYEKIDQIIKQRYNPEQWNIYIAQASDGDNWSDDNEEMEKILVSKLLPVCQYFAYIDIASFIASLSWLEQGTPNSPTFQIMKRLMKAHKNLQARVVRDYPDIFPVFRSLFKKEKE